MALIKCPECDKEVSEKATACIHCGFPLARKRPRMSIGKCPTCGRLNTYDGVGTLRKMWAWLRQARMKSIMQTLNGRQRIVLGVGLCLLVVNCLFPPYMGKYVNYSTNRATEHYVGYGFMLSPPGPRDAFRANTGKELEEWKRESKELKELKELKEREALTGWRSHVIVKESPWKTDPIVVDPPSNDMLLKPYSAHILTPQWKMQGVVIVLVTLGALAIAATRKEEAKE
ncbi:hypothetical protein LCGC14_2398190 [marine sediment metagenome]|uniref:Zinc-ribbon domain-containing protein n=1 Tax=marine sediment metagenome TaxID=412755 RepID=A0A0F9EQI9_9ZZZZ